MLKATAERASVDMELKWGTPEARAKARQELRRELAKEMKRAQIIREAAALGRTPHFDVE
jgi:hypothetical protein